MSESRRHHFIGQSFQARFTDASGNLFVFDKRRPEAGIYVTKPVNAFVKKDLNTTTDKHGNRNTALEQWYSQLESDVTPIIERIVARARERKVPGLSGGDRCTWDTFFYHQQKRAPDAFERLGLVANFESDLPRAVAEFERDKRPLTDEERVEVFSETSRQWMIQRASVRARAAGGDQVMEVLAARGIAVAVIESPKKCFVLGDHPLSRLGGYGRLDHPLTELWMPIAADVAVSPWGAPMEEMIEEIDGERVRRVNRVIFDDSNVVAARSDVLLKSLAGLKKLR